MTEARAFITKNSVYVIAGGRWAKATGLRPGLPSDLLGGWEGLLRLRRGNRETQEWVDCEPEDIRIGDVVHFVSLNEWGACTPVLDIITGTDAGIATDAQLDAAETTLFLSRGEAFIASNGRYEQLLEQGKRRAVTREVVAEGTRYAGTIAVDD